MKRIVPVHASGLIALLCLAAWPLHAAEPLVAGQPILVPGATGGFDFLEVDAAQRRLLASHAGNGTLDVFDLDTGRLLKKVPTGKVQDAAVDAEAGQYYGGVSREQIVAIVDRTRCGRPTATRRPATSSR